MRTHDHRWYRVLHRERAGGPRRIYVSSWHSRWRRALRPWRGWFWLTFWYGVFSLSGWAFLSAIREWLK
jgi:hypothetical protein